MRIEIPILGRSRKYAYLYWNSLHDDAVQKFFGNKTKGGFWFCGRFLGEKNIDIRHRRVYIGTKVMKQIPRDASEFVLILKKDGRIMITFRKE